MAKTKASKTRTAVRKSAAKPAAPPKARLKELREQSSPATAVSLEKRLRAQARDGERLYEPIREPLERAHFGSYMMINIDTKEYVVAPTTSQVHAKFIEKFGDAAPGWCTRIGASVFATA